MPLHGNVKASHKRHISSDSALLSQSSAEFYFEICEPSSRIRDLGEAFGPLGPVLSTASLHFHTSFTRY